MALAKWQWLAVKGAMEAFSSTPLLLINFDFH